MPGNTGVISYSIIKRAGTYRQRKMAARYIGEMAYDECNGHVPQNENRAPFILEPDDRFYLDVISVYNLR